MLIVPPLLLIICSFALGPVFCVGGYPFVSGDKVWPSMIKSEGLQA